MSGYREYDASAEYLHLLSAPMWPALGPRLAAALGGVDIGAGPVLELQPPAAAVEVPVMPWGGVTLGGLAYEGRGRAEPTGPDSVRWRMEYRTRRGDTVLATAAAGYDWWIVTVEGLTDELAAAGFTPSVDDDLVIATAPGA